MCVCACACACACYIQALPVCSNISKMQCNQDKSDSCLEDKEFKTRAKGRRHPCPRVTGVAVNTELGWTVSCKSVCGKQDGEPPGHTACCGVNSRGFLNGSERPGTPQSRG